MLSVKTSPEPSPKPSKNHPKVAQNHLKNHPEIIPKKPSRKHLKAISDPQKLNFKTSQEPSQNHPQNLPKTPCPPSLMQPEKLSEIQPRKPHHNTPLKFKKNALSNSIRIHNLLQIIDFCRIFGRLMCGVNCIKLTDFYEKNTPDGPHCHFDGHNGTCTECTKS